MVRLDPARLDGVRRRVSCLDCDSERLHLDERGAYACEACGSVRPRALIIDPEVSWWIAPDGEYWHETAGVFVRNAAGAYLLFRRTKFPSGLTIPAGHVQPAESPVTAAERELREETAIVGRALSTLGEVDIVGDSCRRGADAHRWYCFVAEAADTDEVVLNDEGVEPVWLGYGELRASAELTPATAFLLDRYASHFASLEAR